MTFIEEINKRVHEAYREMMKRDLKANAVLINDRLIYTRLMGTEMICGLRVVPAIGELPDDVEFAIGYCYNRPQTQQERIDQLVKEREALMDRINAAMSILRGEIEEVLLDD